MGARLDATEATHRTRRDRAGLGVARRQAFVEASPEAVLSCLASEWRPPPTVVVPKDARVVAVYYSDIEQVLRVYFTSATLPLVPQGQPVPRYGHRMLYESVTR